MTNDPIDAHVEKMESAVMDARTDKDKSQMKVALKPNKAETKSRDSNKVVLCGILCLSLCAHVGSLAAFFASKETCVTGLALLKEGQEVPLKTERRRLDADNLLRGMQECFITKSGVKECIDGEMIWELADGTMEDIPYNFLKDNTDLTGTLKLGAAVRTIGINAFYKTKLEGLDLSQAKSLESIGAYAFSYTDIGTLMIPAKVEMIGYAAFMKTDITGTLVIPAKVKTIADRAFSQAKLTGLDLSQAASLESIGNNAFTDTDITGTLMIPAKVKTIGSTAFYEAKLTGLDLSNAASLELIGDYAFYNTDITGTLVIPVNVPTYAANSLPSGVTIVKG